MLWKRKSFLAGTLLAATAVVGGCGHTEPAKPAANDADFFPVLSSKDYDYQRMLTILRNPNPHKQLFLSSALPGADGLVGMLRLRLLGRENSAPCFIHMQFAMNGYQFSLLHSGRHLSTLGILIGDAVMLALNADVWKRYEVSRQYNLPKSNVFYAARSNLDLGASPNDPKSIYQDQSAEAVIKRGGRFMICYNALTGRARALAPRSANAMRRRLPTCARTCFPAS